MISYITGTVQKTNISKDSYVDILTNSGIAYRISIPSTYKVPSKGEMYSLYTHFHVRDDNQSLYGFEKEQERDFFEQLISVSGIGPKIGIAVITMFSRKELENKILEGDAKSLSKVPGLGMKGAQKIILELRGKIDFEQKESSEDSIIRELKEALKTLGFSGSQLKESVEVGEKILKKNKDISIEELIKKVLSK
ncbi:MAG: Holliday junction ATP-dependent DNA helicase RuvA [candidate division WS6 bacterium 36_33]|uniref:Holliday junction branch migration complex subunit RuvA n=1 Tax=candidate division WS6 bacterium 36_33 TaxID=1641388 RepID=A0A101GZ12_9BACT|nr:MAG: Holliday junction ATP-dependent DNA helicase RuvA [candidate division WS6 bacterium 36_33]